MATQKNVRASIMRCLLPGTWNASLKAICAVAVVGTPALCVVLMAMYGAADDFDEAAEPQRQHPTHGTHFWFEVIESFNAKYEGDTPGHIGRGGGITLPPHVALGDSVYHHIGDEDKAIGVVTGVTWDRLRGSLTIEFRPKDDHRIAVGDEVRVDLNPVSGGKELSAPNASAIHSGRHTVARRTGARSRGDVLRPSAGLTPLGEAVPIRPRRR